MNAREPEDHLVFLRDGPAEGLGRLPRRFRARHAAFVTRLQNPDGGFPGVDGASDLYYTSFALRAADLLGVQEPALWAGAADCLRAQLVREDVVECLCLLYSRRLVDLHGYEVAVSGVEAPLEACRAGAGCYAGRPGGPASVYHTFLAALCGGLLGAPMPQRDEAVAVVASRQCADGGFADVMDGETPAVGGVNPTAAAVQLLSASGALSDEAAGKAVEFVLAMQRPDGGFAAHAGAPVADLMSTFTALVTLHEAAHLGRARTSAAAHFAGGLAARGGGFRGAPSAGRPDCEYTYYGLGALGLLGWHAMDAGRSGRRACCER